MKLAELKKTEIERKTDIPDDVRTPGKDEVADYIEEEIIDAGRWPMDVIDIAEEVDYSRQHTTNVLKQYFAPAVETANDGEESEGEDCQSITITVPEDVEDEQSFWRGVAEARRV